MDASRQSIPLIAGGATIDRANNAGWTPLHAVSETGNLAMAQLLVAKDANEKACKFRRLDPASSGCLQRAPAYGEMVPGVRSRPNGSDRPRLHLSSPRSAAGPLEAGGTLRSANNRR